MTVVPSVIAGIWRPTDADDPYWMSDPDQTLVDKLLVRRDDYVSHIEPLLNHKVRSAVWQVVLDEKAVVPADAHDYIERLRTGQDRRPFILARRTYHHANRLVGRVRGPADLR